MIKIKALSEEKTRLLEEVNAIYNSADEAKRSLTPEEGADVDGKLDRIKAINDEIARIEKINELAKANTPEEKANVEIQSQRAAEEYKLFDTEIRCLLQTGKLRTDTNLTFSANGAIVPQSIANKIIKKIEDISPLVELANRYNVKGTLSIPYYDEGTTAITVGYKDEFSSSDSAVGKFASVDLTGFLANATVKISKSLINNSDFDVVSLIITYIAESFAKWLEGEMINGTTGKITGLSTATQVVNAVSTTAITVEELMDLQELLPDRYSEQAFWIMNKSTRTALRKLKDSEGRYILNYDPTARWKYNLLGNPVYTSCNVNALSAGGGKPVVYFVDPSGIALKFVEELSIVPLLEMYHNQHAVGIDAWCEVDSKIENDQKVAVLKLKTAST